MQVREHRYSTPRHFPAGRKNRSTHQWRGAIQKLWRTLNHAGLNIGIGDFRRSLSQWVVQAHNQAAQEQAEPSRGPLDQDEPGAVDTRTLDSVENAMDLDAKNLSTQHILMGTIAEQAPLTPTQMQALYGVGFDLLMGASRQQHGFGVRATSSLRDRP